jgi:hypothetical protein
MAYYVGSHFFCVTDVFGAQILSSEVFSVLFSFMKSVSGPNMIMEHMIHYFHLKTYSFLSNCTSSCQ